MSTPPFLQLLQRVHLRNFKSIAECDVKLGPLTFLVGPNGSGKSNFVDALRFVSQALSTSLENAVSDRSGYNELGRKPGTDVKLWIKLDLGLYDPHWLGQGAWEVELRSAPPWGFEVVRESCQSPFSTPFRHIETNVTTVVHAPRYDVESGSATWNMPFPAPDASSTVLFLPTCSGLRPFRPVVSALRSMSCHNFNPHEMREPQAPGPGLALAPDGRNLAAMVHRLGREDEAALTRVIDALRAIVPGLCTVEWATVGPKETLQFTMLGRDDRPTKFYPAQMSDGTLRALGCLVALYGPAPPQRGTGPLLVALEEPETAVHPGAVRVLLDAMREASLTRQVIVTTHSPDLLDHPDISADEIRAVTMVNGETIISEIDDVAREVLRDRLYSAGELHRLGQLTPAEAEG